MIRPSGKNTGFFHMATQCSSFKAKIAAILYQINIAKIVPTNSITILAIDFSIKSV
jgi:hypothetical protein